MLLGLDCGSTAIKAALFDEAGRTLAGGSRRTAPLRPTPGFVEQDMDILWQSAAEAIGEAIAKAGLSPGAVSAVGVTGHGDGLYLADRHGAPLGNGIQSVDSRAHAIVAEWEAAGLLDPAVQ